MTARSRAVWVIEVAGKPHELFFDQWMATEIRESHYRHGARVVRYVPARPAAMKKAGRK